MIFDDLEYISVENQKTSFPKHFHETFCISLIYHGIEQIDFENHSLFSEPGSISIANPYEIHSNPLIDPSTPLHFDTIYLSNDLMKYLVNGKNIKFINQKIVDEKANQLFMKLKKAMDAKNPATLEYALSQFVQSIKLHSLENNEDFYEQPLNDFKEINRYIENNIFDKFCLESLSNMANINKYGFVKKFKASTGMTPMNYILMKKIFSCKALIRPNTELTDLAYQYSFSDLSHFSKTFKRYIGISPKQYQATLTPFSD